MKIESNNGLIILNLEPSRMIATPILVSGLNIVLEQPNANSPAWNNVKLRLRRHPTKCPSGLLPQASHGTHAHRPGI
jgi:hypothetical protein